MKDAHAIARKVSGRKIPRKTAVSILFICIIVAAFAANSYFSSSPGNYDSFAKCLTDKGAVMYGSYQCPHCSNQKSMFGSSWKYVSYVECGVGGENANPELCSEKGITGYPTWMMGNDTRIGEQQLFMLSHWSGCQLP